MECGWSGWETALNEAAVASVVMLGGLHIEMALWNVGGLLEVIRMGNSS